MLLRRMIVSCASLMLATAPGVRREWPAMRNNFIIYCLIAC